MKPGKSVDVREEIAEVHTSARSPSPKHKPRPNSRLGSRKLSNGHTATHELNEIEPAAEESAEGPSDKSKARESWINSEHESIELPIHDQIKQGILGFVEKEFKKSDKNPSFIFYSHDPNGLDEKFMKTLSRPSSGNKEKRSPSYKKKKRHSSRHRDKELHDFEVPGSSLSALEKVDDYLKEYNKDEVVTLSGELEIDANDRENNNGGAKEIRHKPRKTKRKSRDERHDTNANGKDVSPKVFKTTSKSKAGKSARPTDLSAMLESLESNTYHDQYIDNPFSSPSPLTSPNDERLRPLGSHRPEKIYLQGGGTFRAVSSDRILATQQTGDEERYSRLGELSPLDIAISGQKAWGSCVSASPGVLGGLALLHLLLIGYTDGLDAGHLSFHAVVTMPYVAAYFFFCVLCMLAVLDRPGVLGGLALLHLLLIGYTDGFDAGHLSFHAVVTMPYVAAYFFFCVLCMLAVLDRLDITSIDLSRGLQPYFQPIVLVILYMACLLVCTAARMYDELMVYQYTALVSNITANVTTPTIPTFYHTWTHFSIWRAVLSILGLVYFIISNPQDMVYANLNKLLQFKHSLQSIG